MSMLPLCRVCLSNDAKLCSVNNVLTNVYEKLTDFEYNKAGYPLSMCYICLSVLRKCHRFMETARDTNRLLEQWYNRQNETKIIKARPVHSLNITSAFTIDTTPSGENTIEIVPVIKKEDKYETDEEQEKGVFIEFEKLDTEPTHDVGYDLKTSLDTGCAEDNIDNGNETKLLTFHEEWFKELPILSDGNDSDLMDSSSRIKEQKMKTASNVLRQRIKKLKKEKKDKSMEKTPIDSDDAITNCKNENKQYKCEKCDLIYKNKNNLRRHIVIAHESTIFYCKNANCNYKTTNKYSLKSHKTKHSTEKPFSCIYCNFKTARKLSLNLHTKQHTNERNFTCEICDEKFFQIGQLQNHLHKHNNEKPYICNVCGKTTLYKTTLERHLRSVHNNEKPYSCEICSKNFAQKKTLKRHVMVHNGEKPCICAICNYKCVDKDRLKMHMRIHYDERPYPCHICNFTAKKKCTLSIHMRIHTGEKPYACDLCSYKCSQKSALNTHLKRHKREAKDDVETYISRHSPA